MSVAKSKPKPKPKPKSDDALLAAVKARERQGRKLETWSQSETRVPRALRGAVRALHRHWRQGLQRAKVLRLASGAEARFQQRAEQHLARVRRVVEALGKADPALKVKLSKSQPEALVVAVATEGAKKTGSTDGMQHAATTSPYYRAWVESAPATPGWIRVRHRDGASGFVRVSQVWGV